MRDIMEAMSMLTVFLCSVLIYCVGCCLFFFDDISPVRLIVVKDHLFNLAVCKLVYINHVIHWLSCINRHHFMLLTSKLTWPYMMVALIICSFYRNNPKLKIRQ